MMQARAERYLKLVTYYIRNERTDQLTEERQTALHNTLRMQFLNSPAST